MRMKERDIVLLLGLAVVLYSAESIYGLDITFDANGANLTIIDGGAGDLNALPNIIDFAPAAVGGVFLPAGRGVRRTGARKQQSGCLGRTVRSACQLSLKPVILPIARAYLWPASGEGSRS